MSHTHDIHADKDEVKSHVKGSITFIFISLAIMVATNFKVGLLLLAVVALSIAFLKREYIKKYCQHLIATRNVPFWLFLITVLNVLLMIVLIYLSYFNVPEGLTYVS